jgi:hypothetical protein
MIIKYDWFIDFQFYVFTSGIREAEINVAEGRKKAKILNSEAFKAEQINNAEGMSKLPLIFQCIYSLQSWMNTLL